MSTQNLPVFPHETPVRLAPRAGRTLAATLGLLLLPKCPLCIAAYLVGLGLSSGAAAFAAPFVRPLALIFVIATCAGLAYGAWDRQTRQRRARERGQHQASALPSVNDGCCCD